MNRTCSSCIEAVVVTGPAGDPVAFASVLANVGDDAGTPVLCNARRVLLRPFGASDGVYLSQDLRGRAVVDVANRRGTTVDLPCAATVDLGSHVLRHRTPVVRGRVVGRSGRPIAHAYVRLARTRGEEEPPAGSADHAGERSRLVRVRLRPAAG